MSATSATSATSAPGGVRDALERVRAAPSKPAVAAVVQVDDALLSGRVIDPWLAPSGTLPRLGGWLRSAVGAGPSRTVAEEVDDVVRGWAGRDAEDLDDAARGTFRSRTAARIHTELWRIARAHRAQGHTLVLVSAAPRPLVEPVAAELGADHVLATDVEVDVRDGVGVLTGERDSPVLAGEAVAVVLGRLAESHGLDLSASFAYADGDGVGGDTALLDAVGTPVVVAPSERARAEAATLARPVLDCVERGGTRLHPAELASTAGFYGGFVSAAAVGVGVGALHGTRRAAWNGACMLAADVGLGLAGVDVAVSGAEHVWSQRPAIFVFNHQGLIDPIIVMKLLQGDFTGVAKAETRTWPVFGQLFQLADVAFVDRSGASAEQVRTALEPAVEKVRSEGMSLAMAPEGTRSPTPTPGRFKKGAFHIAMDAGVPMVPIVLQNTGEIMWRTDLTVRSGTVRVVVHPPIDTSGWTQENLDEQVASVRDLFVATLDGGAP